MKHNTTGGPLTLVIGILILSFLVDACSSKQPIANDPINSLINKYEVRFNEADSGTTKTKIQEQFDVSLQNLLKDSMRGAIQIPVIIKEKTEVYGRDADWITVVMQNGKISFKQVIASGDLKSEPLFQMFEQKKKGDSIILSARLKEIRYYPMQPAEREQKLVIPEIHVFVDGISYSNSAGR